MNVVINKSTKEVIWVNPDLNKLSGEDVFGGFKAGTMQAVFCPGYQPKIGEVFKPTIANNTILEFQPKTIYNKDNMASRQLLSWNDMMDENETTIEPKSDMVEGRKVYKRFQSFVNNDWVVDTEAEYEATVPLTLTPAQARLALLAINKLDTVEALMTQETTPREAKILWEYATIFERKNLTLIGLATSLQMDKAAIDQLFIEGAKIN